MRAQAIRGDLAPEDNRPAYEDARRRQSGRAIAILEKLLGRLGAARVRTTFFLVRIDGLAAPAAEALCAEAAGSTRFHLPLDAGTFLVVDIGPRRQRNIEKAEHRITAAMIERLAQLAAAAAPPDGAPPLVYLNVVHSWNFELIDLSFVIRQLRAAPPAAI